MINASISRRGPEGGEIDLISLLYGLWAQKFLIVLVTLVVTLGAASYAFLSKPVYESRIALRPPAVSDIASFNLARGGKSGLTPFSVGDIFAVFTRNLLAEDSRRQFFRNVYLPSLNEDQRSSSQDGLYKAFSEVLRVKAPTKSQPGYVVAVERLDPGQAAEWVKLFVDQVTRQSLSEILQNNHREVEVRGRQIQQEINTLKLIAKMRRNDRLIRLKEALVVAESVGLASPPVISGQIAQQLSAFMDGDLMYMRGSKALRAEIEALESRASDDPFIPALRNLEERYNLLTAFQVSSENVAVSRPDGAVLTPDEPIKPKKVLVLVLGVLLGGMLGLFIALLRLMFSPPPTATQEVTASTSFAVQGT